MATVTARLLDQDHIWISSSYQRHELDRMDPDHRANLIPFLRGNARTLHVAATGTEAVSAAAAEEWLERTPLMRRLVQLEAGRPIEARHATHLRNLRHEAETGYQKVRLG